MNLISACLVFKCNMSNFCQKQHDVIKWKHFPLYWPFVRGIHWSSVNAQRQVMRNFDIFFDLRLIKRLSKHSGGRWFETLSRQLWRHCNEQSCKNCWCTRVTAINMIRMPMRPEYFWSIPQNLISGIWRDAVCCQIWQYGWVIQLKRSAGLYGRWLQCHMKHTFVTYENHEYSVIFCMSKKLPLKNMAPLECYHHQSQDITHFQLYAVNCEAY